MTIFGKSYEEQATALIQKHYEAMYTLKGQPQEALLQKARKSALVSVNYALGCVPESIENRLMIDDLQGVKHALEKG